MALASSVPTPDPGGAPAVRLRVCGAQPLPYAAAPALRFTLGLDAGTAAVRSVMLDVQIQIAARRRGYPEADQDRLGELFGVPRDWGRTLRTLPWLRATVVVPPFHAATSVELDVPCTYDFEVTAARYLAALSSGVVPLELLFSGTVFFADARGALQAARIGLDQEADYDLPLAVWRRAIDAHFPGAAWLRIGADRHAALSAFKARHGFADWDATVDALLVRAEEELG